MEEIKFAVDTFYAVMAGALVMWMAAGFTMLEAGMIKKKNAAEIVTKNLGLYSIACIMYLVCGFALMYPGGAFIDGIIPSIGTSLGLSTSMDNADIGIPYSMEYSQQADFFFQVVFVATAMSIVSGAVAGRMKILPFFLFAIVLTGFIYPIQGYWNWGEGFLNSSLGYSDYAGSGTVHLCGAAAALAVVHVLGPRKGKYNSDGSSNVIAGSNIPMAALGVWILWLGWFGFNGGSELVVSNESAAINVSQVFLNTNIAAAGGVVASLMISQLVKGKMDITMAMNGAIAGLVAITAAPSAPSAGAALLIGAVGGIIVYFSIIGLDKRGIDDPVGAISAHGVVGIWGVMAVCFTGGSLFAQAAGVLAIAGFTYVASLITILVIDKFIPIRASDMEQETGLDLVETGVEAYPEF
jgi:Amt family ammonium transporter